MPDLLNERIRLRHIITGFVATIVFTVGVMNYIESKAIPQNSFATALIQIKQNSADVIDLKIIIAQNKILINNTIDMVKDVRDRCDPVAK